MDKLLKEAIADAKAVRETALANAKIALEEAFAPKLQSMLAAKLSEEEEETVDVGLEDTIGEDEDLETQGHGTEVDAIQAAEEEAEEDEVADEFAASDDEEIAPEVGLEEDYAEDTEEGGEQAQEEEDAEYAGDEETPDEEEITAELAEIIKELEEEDHEEEVDHDKDAAEDDYAHIEDLEKDAHDDREDESIDLDEIIRALKEDDGEEAVEDAELEVSLEGKLEEAYDVIRTLKGQLTEVNVLNAKLLYANKIFRTYNLSESQKMKVIEAVDRAKNVREIKLVYSTLAENFGNVSSTPKKRVIEGFASKSTASTKPPRQKILTEANAQAERFKKLAGLIK
jgi:hypothetical protein